jgi:2-desacetyl-2-hydroxyethyl bacteriochlorophyllide A dehydrogenase
MHALVISRPGQFEVETVRDPTPGRGELVVAPRAVGVCGTDLHIVDGHFPPAVYPLIPGHEFAGEVVAVGKEVEEFSLGDRVAVDPSLFCGHCTYCRRQRGNLCVNWGAIGDTVNGAFAEYVPIPSRNAYRLPDDMTWGAGALVEPLSCVVHGLRRLDMAAGSELLIVGAGTIGLLLLQSALRSGATAVDVVDTDPSRREIAKTVGARIAAASIEELLEHRSIGYEYSIEATGVPAAATAALAGLCRGGTMLVFGVAPAEARLPLSQFAVYNDEITVLGSMAVLNTFEPALRLMETGAIRVDAMVTHTYALHDFSRAIEAVRAREGLKVQVDPSLC